MKRTLYTAIALMLLTACGNNTRPADSAADSLVESTPAQGMAPAEDSAAQAESAAVKAQAEAEAQAAADDAEMEALARSLPTIPRMSLEANNYARLKQACTKRLMRELAKEYEDEYGDPGYATWMFDCGCQDSGKTVVTAVSKTGPNTYKVTGRDTAYPGSFEHIFTFAKEGGRWKVDKCKQTKFHP